MGSFKSYFFTAITIQVWESLLQQCHNTVVEEGSGRQVQNQKEILTFSFLGESQKRKKFD